MAGGNAIGTGAIILTANADQAMSSFLKVSKGADKLASDVGKTGSKAAVGKGSFLNTLLGAGGGVAAGAAKGIASALSGALSGGLAALAGGPLAGIIGGQLGSLLNPQALLNGIRDKIESVRDKATSNDQLGALDSVSAAITRIDRLVDQLSAAFLTALAPAISTATDIIEAAFDHWGVDMKLVMEAISTISTLAVDMAGFVLGGIMEVIDATGEWIGKFGEVASAGSTISSRIVGALRPIGIAFAYVWDTAKLGVGVFSILEGAIINVIGRIETALADFFKSLPDELRPEWADTYIDKLGQVGKVQRDLGDHLAEWGLNTFSDWGSSAERFRQIFDGLGSQIADKEKMFSDAGKAAAPTTKLAGAFDSQSREAYSITAQYNASGRDMASLQQQQIKAVENGNKILGNIEKNTKDKIDPYVKFGAV